jgi:hypothetical protein
MLWAQVRAAVMPMLAAFLNTASTSLLRPAAVTQTTETPEHHNFCEPLCVIHVLVLQVGSAVLSSSAGMM